MGRTDFRTLNIYILFIWSILCIFQTRKSTPHTFFENRATTLFGGKETTMNGCKAFYNLGVSSRLRLWRMATRSVSAPCCTPQRACTCSLRATVASETEAKFDKRLRTLRRVDRGEITFNVKCVLCERTDNFIHFISLEFIVFWNRMARCTTICGSSYVFSPEPRIP